ncbi:MAG: DUF4266 domain-containing protein [Saprospiraceae bacterium]|jgi:hypothetical protein|nr:DUF4266 domain-containing protein [Saprospiraceae bacterium]
MKILKSSNFKFAIVSIAIVLLASCNSAKPLSLIYINDGEMPLSIRKVEKSEISFQLYREGAAGATGGKSSGGCGCN